MYCKYIYLPGSHKKNRKPCILLFFPVKWLKSGELDTVSFQNTSVSIYTKSYSPKNIVHYFAIPINLAVNPQFPSDQCRSLKTVGFGFWGFCI